jgi:hypothetical protein
MSLVHLIGLLSTTAYAMYITLVIVHIRSSSSTLLLAFSYAYWTSSMDDHRSTGDMLPFMEVI